MNDMKRDLEELFRRNNVPVYGIAVSTDPELERFRFFEAGPVRDEEM